MSDSFSGFAVFDLETTGLSPRHHHRVVEIGVVRLDEDFDVIERWETLIDPERDLSAGDIHGITSSDVKGAPTFAQLVVDIWHRFEGAIPVAHNFSFDRRFLLAEMERAGIELDHFDGICTMRLADQLGLECGSRKLVDICEYLGTPIEDAHSAGCDASMCAEVLRHLAREADLTQFGTPVSCQKLWAQDATPLGITRQKARSRPIESPLQTVAHRISGMTLACSADRESLDEYLLTLDRLLEDRVVDPEEVDELLQVAIDCGLTVENIKDFHQKYVETLAAHILSDGVVTEDELRDLRRVAGLLRVDQEFVESCLNDDPTATESLQEDLSGHTVCFTGELRCSHHGDRMDKKKAEELSRDAGLVPKASVTKKLDILVVADPDTSSSKAKKARQYGLRIIAERAFWHKLGIDVG